MLKPGIDLDNCVLDTAGLMLDRINSIRGSKFILDNLVDYSFEKSLGVGTDVVRSAVDAVVCLDEVPIVPGADQVLSWLQLVCSPLFFISDRLIKNYAATYRQLDKFGLSGNVLILTGQMIEESALQDKVFFVNELELDVFIEDKSAVVHDLYNRTMCEIIVFDRPWNQELKSMIRSSRVHFVRSWAEIRDFFMAKFREE